MRRWLCIVALVLPACGGPAAPWTAPPELALDLKISVSATEVPLLQPVTVHLDRYRQAELEVEFTPTVEAQDFLCDTSTLPEVPFGDGFWQRTTLVLQPVRGPGELVLPAFEARAADGSVAASTPEQHFQITSMLAGQGDELEAPAAPFAAEHGLLFWGLFVAGWVVLLLLLLWLFTRKRRLRRSPGGIAVPPHIVALRALQRLRSAARGTTGEVEAFYVEVSAVLRRYLEDGFGLRAPERTTEEFLRELESGSALVREHRAELQQFLSQCDLVKFAAWQPTESDHLATFAIAEAFVERTRADRDGEPSPAPEVHA